MGYHGGAGVAAWPGLPVRWAVPGAVAVRGGLIKCCQFCRSEALFVAGQFSRLGLLSAEGDAAVRNELQGKAVRVAEQVLNQQFY